MQKSDCGFQLVQDVSGKVFSFAELCLLTSRCNNKADALFQVVGRVEMLVVVFMGTLTAVYGISIVAMIC